MAFALMAGLASCDKKESMKELTIEMSVYNDSTAQFRCIYTPADSKGYALLYDDDSVMTNEMTQTFYERVKESIQRAVPFMQIPLSQVRHITCTASPTRKRMARWNLSRWSS